MSNLVRRIAILQLLSHAYCTQRYWLDLLLKPYSNYPDISLLSLLLPSSFFDQHVSILMTTPLFLFIRRTCGWIYLSSLLAQLFTRRTGLKSRTSLLPLWSAVISLCLLACFDCVYPLQSPILTGISLWISSHFDCEIAEQVQRIVLAGTWFWSGAFCRYIPIPLTFSQLQDFTS